MDALLNAFAGMLGKISDPLVIVLMLLLAGSEWLRLTQSREHNKDRNEIMLPALKEVTSALQNIQRGLTEELNDIKNAISAKTGSPM